MNEQRKQRSVYNEAGLRRCCGYKPCGIPPHFTHPDNFGKHRRFVDGLDNRCKQCMSASNKMRYVPGSSREPGGLANTMRRRLRGKEGELDPSALRSLAIKRDGLWCYLCGKSVLPSEVQVDHVHPVSRGGSHVLSNMRVAHASCNLRKGKKLLEEFDWWVGVLPDLKEIVPIQGRLF